MPVLSLVKEQLFSRPDEQRFESIPTLRADADTQEKRCTTLDARDDRILFSEDGGQVHFIARTPGLTQFALGQLATMARMPMPVLERLDGDTRAKSLSGPHSALADAASPAVHA